MYAWETLNIYCQQDERWFEPVARHVPDGTHLRVCRAAMPATWTLRRRGLWFIAEPPGTTLPEHGWKLHVSARSQLGIPVLRAAVPVLRDHETHFKFLVDPWAHSFTNGKLWPRGSGGKFITAYPVDLTAFRQVARALTEALADFTGPYILSDRRCPGSTSVYYRYGGFVGQPRLRADGGTDLTIQGPDGNRYPDIRNPFWSAPPWVDSDPFDLPVREGAATDDHAGGLADGRFVVESALTFTNRGGVYRAKDRQTGHSVVIKEARPGIGLGVGHGGDLEVMQLLEKEQRILTTLAEVPEFVNPVALFGEWEHLFLVEEFIAGRHLGQLSISANPLYGSIFTGSTFAAYHGRMRGLFAQVCAGIAAAHRNGIVLGDLSWTNVLVDDADRIHIIDVEGAQQTGVDPSTGLYTPGVSDRRTNASEAMPADDYLALGLMMFGSLALNNAVVGFHPPVLSRFLDELAQDLSLPNDLVELVRDLTTDQPTHQPDGDTIAKRIQALSVADPSAWAAVPPLAKPAADQLVAERAARVRANIHHTIAGVSRYLLATASPLRDDRLFPADLGVFETNPLSVAFGAVGVLRALQRLSGEVPSHLLAWVLQQDIAADEIPPGLYFGRAGIAWGLDELGESELATGLLREVQKDPLLWDRADIIHGCAGYGLAALRLWRTTGEESFCDEAVRVGAHLDRTAQRNRHGSYWPLPDGRVPIGYGHGASGVALFLLYLFHATGDEDALRLGRRALDFDLAHAQTTDQGVTAFPASTDDSRAVLRGYWDYGTAGVITSLVRYVASTGAAELAGWLERLLPDIKRKYAVLPQLFHGLAGVGNAMLDVAELTHQPDLIAEAMRTAEGVLLFAIERDEGVAFPGEQALRETGDYASGSAGVALFLDRVLRAGPGRRTNFNFVVDELLPEGPRRP